MSESSMEESKSESEIEKSLDNWIGGKWHSRMKKDMITEVILIGKNEGSEIVDTVAKDQRLSTVSVKKTTYSAMAATTHTDHTTLRICLMLEPGNTKEEMERAYQNIRQRGMPVILGWNRDKKSSCFIQTSVNAEECAVLFDDSEISKQAMEWIGKEYSFNR